MRSQLRAGAILRAPWLIAFYLAGVAWLTWPLAGSLSSVLPCPTGMFMHDVYYSTWVLAHEGQVPNGAIGWGTGFLCIGAVVLGGPRNGRRPATLYLTLALIIALLSLGPTMHLSSGFAPGIPGPYPLLSFIPGW